MDLHLINCDLGESLDSLMYLVDGTSAEEIDEIMAALEMTPPAESIVIFGGQIILN